MCVRERERERDRETESERLEREKRVPGLSQTHNKHYYPGFC